MAALLLLTAYAWGPDVRLTNDLGYSHFDNGGGTIRWRNDTLHVVFDDDRAGGFDVWYARSADDGATWQPEVTVSSFPESEFFPQAWADDAGNVHVVWDRRLGAGRQIFYARSTDGGTTWGAAVQLSNCAGGCGEQAPVGYTSSGFVHVVWETGAVSAEYRRSTDYGVTWQPVQSLGPAGYNLNLGTDGWDAVYAAGDGGWLRRSTNDGATWQPAQTHGVGGVTAVTGAVGGDAYLFGAASDVQFQRSTDYGAAWSAPVAVSTGASATMPATAADSSGRVYAVWTDSRWGDAEIYFNASTDYGATWTGETRLTNAAGTSARPGVAVDSAGCAHVVWWDGRDGNNEIYYKRMTACFPLSVGVAEGRRGGGFRLWAVPDGVRFTLPSVGPWSARLYDVGGRLAASASGRGDGGVVRAVGRGVFVLLVAQGGVRRVGKVVVR